jgi:hypothetical protein
VHEVPIEVVERVRGDWPTTRSPPRFVSVNAIRTHVQSVHRLLGVRRRKVAVQRARELNILPG